MSGIARYKTQLAARMLFAVKSAAEQAAAYAHSIVPVGDGSNGGHLRDCISHRAQMEEHFAASEVLADNPHALYVEMGTGRMAAQPYLRPALQANKARFLQALKK